MFCLRPSGIKYFLILAILFIAVPAYADGIDLVWFFTRAGGENSSIARIVVIVLLLMIVNYILNFIVIGWPAIRFGSRPTKQVATGLVVLTLLGQVADRIGALLAALLAVPIVNVIGIKGEGDWLVPLIALNFLFSGAAVGGLVLFFLRKKWNVTGKPIWFIASAAAIFTNPAWTMGTLFLMKYQIFRGGM